MSVICTGVEGRKHSPAGNLLELFTAVAKLCCQYPGPPFSTQLQKLKDFMQKCVPLCALYLNVIW